jgi:hypothetical protein
MPNLSDAVLEAGGAIYSRAARTDKFSELLSVNSSAVMQLAAGLSGVNIAALQLAGTAVGSTAAEIDAVADVSTVNVARTATTDGLTTAIITSRGMLNFITVTSSDANFIIVLPAPTPGTIVILRNGSTGYELRSSAPATVAINGGTDTAGESAIAASAMVIAICTTATTWQAISLAATTLAAVEAAAN